MCSFVWCVQYSRELYMLLNNSKCFITWMQSEIENVLLANRKSKKYTIIQAVSWGWYKNCYRCDTLNWKLKKRKMNRNVDGKINLSDCFLSFSFSFERVSRWIVDSLFSDPFFFSLLFWGRVVSIFVKAFNIFQPNGIFLEE